MYRHPYQMEVDAAYARDQIATQVARCRSIDAPRPQRTAGTARPVLTATRRVVGVWLIGIGERLTETPHPKTPPAWSSR